MIDLELTCIKSTKEPWRCDRSGSHGHCFTTDAASNQCSKAINDHMNTSDSLFSYLICFSTDRPARAKRLPSSLWPRNSMDLRCLGPECWSSMHQMNEVYLLFGKRSRTSQGCNFQILHCTTKINTHVHHTKSLYWMKRIVWRKMLKALWGELWKLTARSRGFAWSVIMWLESSIHWRVGVANSDSRH